jgi:hypothetical protein
MVMILRKIPFAALVCATFVTLVAVGASADSRPTRSECIIGFRLDWSQVKSDHHEMRNSLGREVRWITTRPAMTISLDGTRLYLQFRRYCERKDALAAEVIAFWRSKGLDLPRFERITEPIAPSPDTIDVRGSSWRDDPKDAPRSNK